MSESICDPFAHIEQPHLKFDVQVLADLAPLPQLPRSIARFVDQGFQCEVRYLPFEVFDGEDELVTGDFHCGGGDRP